jgi:periplasmic copper chaperone A
VFGIRQASAVLVLGMLAVGPSAWAGVQVSGAWARATLPGQKVGALYMQLRSDVPARLVGVRSPAARAAEVHQMSNDGGVMRMRHIDSLELPAGKTVVLEPGGYHVMLLDIDRPLKAGDHVAVTLVIEEGGKRFDVPVDAQVRSTLDEDPHAHRQ